MSSLKPSITSTTSSFPENNNGTSSSSSSSSKINSTGTKKKFGKNLNKLLKQPAPPITTTAPSQLKHSTSSSSTSRNGGLLLLSTNKKSLASSGLLHLQQPKSAHDALLTAAAAAAAGISPEKEKPLPAWGMAATTVDKNTTTNDKPNDNLHPQQTNRQNEIIAANHHQVKTETITEKETEIVTTGHHAEEPNSQRKESEINNSSLDFNKESTTSTDNDENPVTNKTNKDDLPIPKSSTSEDLADENKKSTNTASSTSSKFTESQVEFMARLARERSEKKRLEEEKRVAEQKERAALRLKELENKLGPSSSRNNSSSAEKNNDLSNNNDNTSWKRQTRDRSTSSDIVLEPLGRTKKKTPSFSETEPFRPNREKNTDTTSKRNVKNPRTLYDPNRTYSSLVGGGSNNTKTVPTKNKNNNNEEEKPMISIEIPHGSDGRQRENSTELNNISNEHSANGKSNFSKHVIQLSSYEDRDRGTSSGPRMLFDPKSGSMVAAPAPRNDEMPVNNKGGKKDRTKKNRLNLNGKERDDMINNNNRRNLDATSRRRSSSDDKSDESGGDMKTMRRSRNDKKDDNNIRSIKDRKRFGDRDKLNDLSKSPHKKDSFDLYNSKKSSTRRKSSNNKIPRTCGVLYKRDNEGRLLSVDGCDGDQGYGAHSVPGGRLRSPEAHALFLEESHQKLMFQDRQNSAWQQDPYYNNAYNNNLGINHDNHDYSFSRNNHGKYMSEHSENAYSNEYLGSENTNSMTSQRNEALILDDSTFDIPSPLRVGRDDKIELLTGGDESPTLQATAAAWAPSEAALAAVVANDVTNQNQLDNDFGSDELSESDVPAMNAISVINNDDDDYDEEDKDMGESTFLGLGFDPTENMDSVIMTPTTRGKSLDDNFNDIDMSSLSLNSSTNLQKSNVATSHNPFGALNSTSSQFLGSSTWGTTGTNGISSLSNWNYLGNVSNHSDSNNVSNPKMEEPASFLSLSTLGNKEHAPWSSGAFTNGLSGLSGSTLSNTAPDNNAGPDTD